MFVPPKQNLLVKHVMHMIMLTPDSMQPESFVLQNPPHHSLLGPAGDVQCCCAACGWQSCLEQLGAGPKECAGPDMGCFML